MRDKPRMQLRTHAITGNEYYLRSDVLNVLAQQQHEITQSLGKALGYPWYKDDQKNFPGATGVNGVCVGEHVAETIAEEAADRIKSDRELMSEAFDLIADAIINHGMPVTEKVARVRNELAKRISITPRA